MTISSKDKVKSKSSTDERIKELEKELSGTKYNKRTQGHFAVIKAKIAALKEKKVSQAKGKGKTEGYTVKKSGDASVIMVGFPSVGKSTLLNTLTNADSETGAYAFTTLTCIPGMLNYKHSKIQILDVPGIVDGAASGRGRGKEVLSVAINSDLVMFLIDVFNPEHYATLMKEVREFYLRINEEKPDVKITKKAKGGISIGTTVKLTKLDKPTIVKMLNTFRIMNADVLIRTDINADQLIDCVEANKHYIPGLVVLNKVDIASKEQIEKARKLVKPDIMISGTQGLNIAELKELIFQKLGFMRVYCKDQGKKADLEEPLIMRRGNTLGDMCDKLHRGFRDRMRFARIWGSSKFPGQEIRKFTYPLQDEDIVELVLD